MVREGSVDLGRVVVLPVVLGDFLSFSVLFGEGERDFERFFSTFSSESRLSEVVLAELSSKSEASSCMTSLLLERVMRS